MREIFWVAEEKLTSQEATWFMALGVLGYMNSQ
jgi:hypothetical protein